MTIRPSFQKAGLWPDSGTKPFKLQFNEESLRKNPRFEELWEQNISVEELSQRRRLQPFGIINKQFLQWHPLIFCFENSERLIEYSTKLGFAQFT
jgi:hypothetical protein